MRAAAATAVPHPLLNQCVNCRAVWTWGPTTAMQVCRWLCSTSHSHMVLDGCLEVVLYCYTSYLLAGCLLNEGARESSSRQAITPVRYGEGTSTTNHNYRYRGEGTP